MRFFRKRGFWGLVGEIVLFLVFLDLFFVVLGFLFSEFLLFIHFFVVWFENFVRQFWWFVLFFLFCVCVFFYFRLDFERKQRLKGFVRFVNVHGRNVWGLLGDAKSAEFCNKVCERIREFEPSLKYGLELGYQAELQGWLKSEFSGARLEVQTGASRPDIVIDNVAIEVKGPTDNSGLNTLASKCLKYSSHYDFIVLVLFEPVFSEPNFEEIMDGVKRHFHNVKIICK